MPSSPSTPTRRRKSSTRSFDLTFAPTSPQSNRFSPGQPSRSRKSSLYSIPSPVTPRPTSSYDRNGDFGLANGLGGVLQSGNGLGSLADELAEAWEEEDDVEGESEVGLSGVQVDGAGASHTRHAEQDIPPVVVDEKTLPSPKLQHIRNPSLGSPIPATRSKHRRKQSQYDGSACGGDSDFEENGGLTPALEARIATIENLARRGTGTNASDADLVIKRVADSLKHLGSQSGVENGATRLITAHTALSTHLTHQTRVLQSLAHPLLSPLSPPLDLSQIDLLLPALTSLIPLLPIPSPQPLSSLLHLHSSTTDLISTIAMLSDTLHMTRSTTSIAARRLRAARDMVDEMKREEEKREEGIRWVERGGWEERLAGRECAGICGEVVGGFEEVCRGWRERLVGGLEMGPGGVEVAAG